jgi:magnesium-transporting ATPase (P-type)
MLSIMSPQSVPKKYNSKLREFASSGFRILAIASKQLPEDWRSQDRAQLESNL